MHHNDITIRNATPDDAEALLGIYAPYVEQTAITFEIERPTLADFRQRIETISAEFPYLVAETGGHIAGYSYANRFMERAAYNHCV